MFVVWGTKIKTYNLGVVADYCPICRRPQAFRLKEYCEAGHLYFISLTHGKPFKYTAICQECGVEKAPSTGLVSRAIKVKHSIGIDELIAQTFPGLETKKRKIIERNERLKEDPASFSAEERIKLVQEPFIVMETAISNKQEKSSHQKNHPLTYLGVVGVIAFAVMALVFLAKWSDRSAPQHLVFATLGGAGLLASGFVIMFGYKLGIRSKYYPILERAYAPLNPSLDELKQGFTGSRSSIAKKIKPHHLFEHLQFQSRMHRR